MNTPSGWSSPDAGDGPDQNDSHQDAVQPGGTQQPGGGEVPRAHELPSAPPPAGYGWNGPTGYGKPGVIPLRPLTVGEILDGAVTTIRTHPGVVIGMSVAVMAVVQVLNAVVLLTFRDRFQTALPPTATLTEEQALDILGSLLGASGVTIVITVLATTILAGFLTIVVGKAVLGQSVRAGAAWSEIGPMLPRLLGLTVIYTLVTTVGLLLFILPGVWLYVLFALATPALVLERGRVFQAMGRSRLLVQNSWWRTFGVVLLAGVIAAALSFVISIPFELAGGGSDSAGGGAGMSTGSILLSSLGGVVAGAIAQPFSAGVTALLYVDQRMRKEGMDIQLARASGLA